MGPSALELLDDGRQLTDRWQAWLVTIVISALAFAIRIVNIQRPGYLIFDETYYPKDAWTLLHLGYEANWPDPLKIANPSIASGHPNVYATPSLGFTPGPEFVVHPQLGKWFIALGEWAFGMNSFGWRFPSLVAGTIMIGATIMLARRLSRSTMIGALAGILLTFDGLQFAMSRIGLLDIFQGTLLVIAVAFAVRDRDWFRHKLADHLRAHNLTDLGGAFGPALLWRPWRLAAGFTFGLACGVKWNSVFVLASFGVLSVLWDRAARHLAGAGRRSWWALLRDGLPAFVMLVVVALVTYIATWTSWLVTTGGWDRQWGATPASGASIMARHHDWLVAHFGAPLASLMYYHYQIYEFQTGSYMASQTHVYNANPAGWLMMVRVIGLDAVNGIKPGVDGCTAVNDTCLRVISGAGTPVLWWMAAIALVAALVLWLTARDWRVVAPIVAAFSTWIPWFHYDDRPVFFFYAICIIPFTVIVLAMMMGRIIGPSDGPHRKRNALIVGGFVSLVVLDFAFIYPILTDQLLTRHQWLLRMWFPSWI